MALQMQSTVKREGKLQLSLVDVDVPEPQGDEVLVRVQAAPINPSDLGLMLGGADIGTATASGTAERPVLTAAIPPAMMKAMAARLDEPLPVGNEGAGVVVKAGNAPEAQALVGRTVAALGGGMYGQYRCLKVDQCLVLPEGTAPADGASCFVNPLTALGMVETMRLEGHKALVHTAAASNLGKMLNRICLADDVALVNVVRRPAHVELLKSMGARHVCDSSSETFMEDLTDTLAETGATIAFDAIGGGRLASQILTGMEMAINRTAGGFNRYGSSVHKQVYIYGGLDRGPTELNRNFGMAWSVGGWLLMPFLQRVGADAANGLKQRVAAEIETTFASDYTKVVSLAEALQPDEIAVYGRQATGEKYLIDPSLGA